MATFTSPFAIGEHVSLQGVHCVVIEVTFSDALGEHIRFAVDYADEPGDPMYDLEASDLTPWQEPTNG